ncbi:unnamed protein product [Paramecium primaurelia]|uniref:BTB domain-containing protein n=1 Tax=Paramecium primaurelia TaxID=5886 RepID=A0A8S1KEH6_PARPR|nr:unnamed protein product [Paramecium primaurelia]
MQNNNRMIWRKIDPSGKQPGDRAAHSCDLIMGKLFIFGGWNGMNALADIHIYDLNLNQWSELQTNGELPSYRNNHTTAVYQTKLYVHGGHNGNTWLDDLYYLETQGQHGQASWYKVHPQGQIPTARACHSLNIVQKKLYLFGGYDGQECFNEIEIYDIQENRWIQPIVSGTIPTARNAHTMTRYKENLYLFGGHSGAQHLQDLHVFNTYKLEWTQVITKGTLPKGLRGHTANLIQNNIYVFGGYDGSGRSNDLFIFNFQTYQWVIPNHHGTGTYLQMEEVALSQIPQPRQRHSATATENDLIYIFGGFDGNKWLNDLYVLDVGLLENRTIQEENYQRVISNIHKNLFNNQELSDITFQICNQKIYAHKIYLAAQSPQFKALFFSDTKESEQQIFVIENYTYKSFYIFLLFVYTGFINVAELDIELMGEILSLADQYLIDGLKNLMQKSIKKYINNETVCDLLIFAQKCSAHSLKNACMNHLLKNINIISESPQYEKLELQPSLLTEITRALLQHKE